MPWKGKTVMQTRQEFIEQMLNGEKKKAALCREYGISRPTGDKWLKRWSEGVLNLEDRSHLAFHLKNKIDPSVEQAIVDCRRNSFRGRGLFFSEAFGNKQTANLLRKLTTLQDV